jgi:hypothetical protein
MEYKAAYPYVKGLWLLLACNVLFLMSPPPTSVWFILNGIGLAYVLLGLYRHSRNKQAD